MKRMEIMHVIDTLEAAGAERVAVNIVNSLPRDKFIPHLCTTRTEGRLAVLVEPDVNRLRLQRASRLDFGAIVRLRDYIQSNHIRIVHAHSSALFISRLATIGTNATVLWHAHYGRYALEDHRAYHYRVAASGIGGALTVNKEMAEWCSRRLGMPAKAVWYLPNPVAMDENEVSLASALPGVKGSRIVCLANLRPEKDHFTLLQAMARVIQQVPSAHLLLAGKTNVDESYKDKVVKTIAELGLENSVSVLGERHDVAAILKACDVGVMSSASEGLPMSLLEYGAAGLPAVATNVGQCAEVLDYSRAGMLVPPASPEALANVMTQLLQSAELRHKMADKFQERVKRVYGAENVAKQICEIYETVASRRAGGRKTPHATRDVVTSQTIS
jgi:glycosyltransferase involved in cell wall biosynthesis